MRSESEWVNGVEYRCVIGVRVLWEMSVWVRAVERVVCEVCSFVREWSG